MKLRSLSAADLDRVHAIETASSPDPWSRSLFADELVGDRADRHWLVAEAPIGPDGSAEVVAFGGVMLITDEAHIMNVAVDRNHRRRGVAARLVGRLLIDASDRGATASTLEVRVGNLAAIELYRRFGFEEAGRRPRYYSDGTDALIMWLHRLHSHSVRSGLEAVAL